MNAATNRSPPRTRDGETVPTGVGDVVPADVLALLSGVNFSSVEKTLAALTALQEYSGRDTALLAKLSSVPLHRVIVGDPRFEERARATMRVCEEIADTCSDEIDDLLNLTNRF